MKWSLPYTITISSLPDSPLCVKKNKMLFLSTNTLLVPIPKGHAKKKGGGGGVDLKQIAEILCRKYSYLRSAKQNILDQWSSRIIS